tara:strand:- start:49 stop:660 length:612 start_codon:yes stop_codon:yes gene_type:complete
MILLDNYKFDIDNSVFKLRSKEYYKTKEKISKEEPLLKLDSLYIFNKNNIKNNSESFPYNKYKNNINENYLIINFILKHKVVYFIYKNIYNIKNNVIKKFINGEITRENRIKIIPFTKYKLLFIKLNKPILLGKKIKIKYNKQPNYFEIKINLEYPFIKSILNKLIKKHVKIHLGITIETYKEDNMSEELICIVGLNNLNLLS